jgi:hypothetical protein
MREDHELLDFKCRSTSNLTIYGMDLSLFIGHCTCECLFKSGLPCSYVSFFLLEPSNLQSMVSIARATLLCLMHILGLT